MTLLLNILWFILGGWISTLLWLLSGLLLAVTVVGLPWAPAAFRIAGFTAAPFGREAVSRVDNGDVDMVLNLVWLIFAGWWLALHHLVLAVMLAVTLIGIPFAIQHLKLALISLAPVGKAVVEV